MTLDDLVSEKTEEAQSQADTSAKERAENRQERINRRYDKVVGSPPNQKAFKQEKWNEVKAVLMNEMGMKVGEVLSSPSEERYEILHEASMIAENKLDAVDSSHTSDQRCPICDTALDNCFVVIEDKKFCPHHGAIKVAKVLDNEVHP